MKGISISLYIDEKRVADVSASFNETETLEKIEQWHQQVLEICRGIIKAHLEGSTTKQVITEGALH